MGVLVVLSILLVLLTALAVRRWRAERIGLAQMGRHFGRKQYAFERGESKAVRTGMVLQDQITLGLLGAPLRLPICVLA